MEVSFRSPHRYASIHGTARLELAETASLTLNFSSVYQVFNASFSSLRLALTTRKKARQDERIKHRPIK
jgi:hypothetical protein